jgi:uncharacterized membrane protein YjfL (UPF0719 family)
VYVCAAAIIFIQITLVVFHFSFFFVQRIMPLEKNNEIENERMKAGVFTFLFSSVYSFNVQFANNRHSSLNTDKDENIDSNVH